MSTEALGPISPETPDLSLQDPVKPTTPEVSTYGGVKYSLGGIKGEGKIPTGVFDTRQAESADLRQHRVTAPYENPQVALLDKRNDSGYGSEPELGSLPFSVESPTIERGEQPIESQVEEAALPVIQVVFEGKTFPIKKVVEIGKGATGVAFVVMAATKIGRAKLAKIGEEVVLKVVRNDLELEGLTPLEQEAKVKKAQESLKKGYEIHLHLRKGDPYKELVGIQSTPHLVKIGNKNGQLGRAYLETMDRYSAPNSEEFTEQEIQERAPDMYRLFAQVAAGHQTLLEHDIFQNDYTLNNIYLSEEGDACIGDLDSCADLSGPIEGGTLPTALTCYDDFIAFLKLSGSQDPEHLAARKELAEKMIVFSLGCNLYETTKRRFPFEFSDDEGFIDFGDPRRHPIIPDAPIADADPFIARMLSKDASQRPNLSEVIQKLTSLSQSLSNFQES